MYATDGLKEFLESLEDACAENDELGSIEKHHIRARFFFEKGNFGKLNDRLIFIYDYHYSTFGVTVIQKLLEKDGYYEEWLKEEVGSYDNAVIEAGIEIPDYIVSSIEQWRSSNIDCDRKIIHRPRLLVNCKRLLDAEELDRLLVLIRVTSSYDILEDIAGLLEIN